MHYGLAAGVSYHAARQLCISHAASLALSLPWYGIIGAPSLVDHEDVNAPPRLCRSPSHLTSYLLFVLCRRASVHEIVLSWLSKHAVGRLRIPVVAHSVLSLGTE